MRMIPPKLDNNIKSNAERKIFNAISKMPMEGYCFHSVGLANHEYKPYAEADFIILTKRGVLCLEVKGGMVKCENGVWAFTNRFGDTNYKNQGPYDQVVGAMYAVRNSICNSIKTNFACGVVFPDIEFESNNISVIKEVTSDARDVYEFEHYINKCYDYWNNKFNTKIADLNKIEIEVIRNQIREDLHYAPMLNLTVDSSEEQIIRLTKQQVEVFELLQDNERILVQGVAGTGKTLIAIEYAKMREKQGNRVLFLTYNKLLAKKLNNKNKNENIVITSIHELISNYIAINPTKGDKNYFDESLPNQFYKYLTSRKLAGYDVIVLDEGQDLIKEIYLKCIDKLLKGGFAYGKWVIFYDPNQNLFNKSFDNNLKILKKYKPTELKLTKNCRNSKQIADFNKYLTGINTGFAVVDGEKIKIVAKPSKELIANSIREVIQQLYADGFQKEDVVVLSPLSKENSVWNEEKHNIEAGVQYYTIQSFKGLESKIILFIDYDSIIDSWNMKLLYTSLSRARSLAYVFVDKQTEEKIQQKLIDSI